MSASPVEHLNIHDIPAEVLSTTPAEAPPPGVIPDFAHPITCLPEVIAVCSVFLAVALICYAVRIYTKARILRKWGWDDLTISIGFFLSIATLGIFFNGGVHGAVTRHTWEVHLDRLFSQSELLIDYYINVLSPPSVALIKGSLFIQYYSIFHRLRWVRWAVWIGASVHCVFYTILTLYDFILASPRKGEDLLETVVTPRFNASVHILVPSGAIGLVIDIFLLVLPMPAIMQLQMDVRRKLGVIVVFTTGGLAVAASAACLVYRVRLQTDTRDSTWKIAYLQLCGQIEMFAGVTVSSMPSVKRFWNDTFDSRSSRPLDSGFTHSSYMSSTSRDEHKPDHGVGHRQSSFIYAGADERFETDAANILVNHDPVSAAAVSLDQREK